MSKRKIAGNPAIAVAYLRVSTDRQELGPEAQRQAILRWAGAAGVEVVAWCEDLGVSGAAPLEKRPGLLAAIGALSEHNAGLLIVAKRDRLARDVVVAAMVERLAEKAGASVAAADGTGNGEGPEQALMRTLIDAFAAYERALIGARTRAALRVKRERGELVGTAPIGFAVAADGVRLEPRDDEQQALARIHALRAEGHSIRGIAKALDREGVRARSGKWHATTVARALAR